MTTVTKNAREGTRDASTVVKLLFILWGAVRMGVERTVVEETAVEGTVVEGTVVEGTVIKDEVVGKTDAH